MAHKHRTSTKQLSEEGVLLRKLRELKKLSIRDAARMACKSTSWVCHAENGRSDVSAEHRRLLLPVYGQTEQTFDALLRGDSFIASPIRQECLDAVQKLPDVYIEQLHPLLKTLQSFTQRSSQ